MFGLMHGGESGDPLGVERIVFAATQLCSDERRDPCRVDDADPIGGVMQGASDRFAVAAGGFQADRTALCRGGVQPRLQGHDPGRGVAELPGFELAAIEQGRIQSVFGYIDSKCEHTVLQRGRSTREPGPAL